MGGRSSWSITQLTTLTCWILAPSASPCACSYHGLHTHAQDERAAYNGSQDEQSMGVIHSSLKLLIHTKTRLERGGSIRKGWSTFIQCTRQNRRTCTTMTEQKVHVMTIQPQCSHSNMCSSSTRESTSSWKEHEFHFIIPSWSSTQGKW